MFPVFITPLDNSNNNNNNNQLGIVEKKTNWKAHGNLGQSQFSVSSLFSDKTIAIGQELTEKGHSVSPQPFQLRVELDLNNWLDLGHVY